MQTEKCLWVNADVIGEPGDGLMTDFIKSGGQADWMKKGKQHQK
jgi:hypothetical protein